MRKVWDTFGGVHPPENKTQSNGSAIETLPLAESYIVPLNQHIGTEAVPCVAVGQHVLKGEKIANAEGPVSAATHAPTSGDVIAIEPRPVPHPSGMNSLCIVIKADGEDQWTSLSACADYSGLTNDELLFRLREAGIAGMGGAGFPAAIKLHPRATQKIDTLILNGTECEPYITADDRLMREHADDVVQGALLFAQLLKQPKTLLVGIEDNKPEAIAIMEKAVKGTRIEVVSFPTKYPSGGEKQLIQILTGKEVPSNAIPAEIGVVVQNVGTAAAAYRAIRYGEPLISRVTTVVGNSLQRQGNVYALIGTPIAHVLRHHGYDKSKNQRLIIGGPMMGYTAQSTAIPITKTTNCLLAPSLDELHENQAAQACIRCGMCAEVCPAQLLPQQLFWYARAQDVDKLQDYNLFDCIECGACSYACPSHIPLVQYYRAAKGEIRQQEQEKIAADKARERFEARKARLEEVEREKEAKRRARREAAEKAKKQLAATSDVNTEHGAADDNNPEKRQRQLLAAQKHLAYVSEQLETAKTGGEQTRIDAVTARLNDAQKKVVDAQNKLIMFDNQNTPVQTEKIHEKLSLTPAEKAQRNVDSLQQRLVKAQQVANDALEKNLPTLDALQLGVAKLAKKLEDARAELAQSTGSDVTEAAADAATTSAADAAIAKARARAAATASLSAEEKHANHIASLEKRLEKASLRLQQAEQEGSEHIDVLRDSVSKLRDKLAQAQR